MPYLRLPLVAKIFLGFVLGILAGLALGVRADALRPVAEVVLSLLTLLATPLIFLGVFVAMLTADLRGRKAGRLVWLMLSNSTVAAILGLAVVELLRPGRHIAYVTFRQFPPQGMPAPRGPLEELLGRIPHDLVTPFATNDPVGVILLAIAFGLAFRAVAGRDPAIAEQSKLAFAAVIRLLHWLFELLPLAVLAVVAGVVSRTGLAPFGQMAWFIAAVLVSLALTAAFYALRLLIARVPVPNFVRGVSDALLLAFSTASSAATLPVSYACATERLGISEDDATLGVMAGGPVNHDGGALYQVVSAICVSQVFHLPIGFAGGLELVGIAVLASLCTAGVPQAGLVSMVAVFHAMRLPVDWIPFLLPFDWLLDRCRTTINVAGNLVATRLLAG